MAKIPFWYDRFEKEQKEAWKDYLRLGRLKDKLQFKINVRRHNQLHMFATHRAKKKLYIINRVNNSALIPEEPIDSVNTSALIPEEPIDSVNTSALIPEEPAAQETDLKEPLVVDILNEKSGILPDLISSIKYKQF